MATSLGDGTIIFGDGTVQSTKTPTNISAFTNDAQYLTPSNASSLLGNKTQSIGTVTITNTGYAVTLYSLDVNGNIIGGGFYNCNCNC